MQAMSHMANLISSGTGSLTIKLISQGILLVTQVQVVVIPYSSLPPKKRLVGQLVIIYFLQI